MLILGGNQLAAGGYNVDNSLRFDDGSSDYLSKSYGSNGNRKTFTLSWWFKESNSSHASVQIRSGIPPGASGNFFTIDNNVQRIRINGADSEIDKFQLITSQVFRDVSAWYHFVAAFDTTQATASNRIKFYVNGEQVTSFSTEIYPAQNYDTHWGNSSETHTIGAKANGDNGISAYMAEVCYIDGTALDPTSFGEFDEDTGIWKPISVSGLTFGTNGFYLPFENSAALGQDDSGNGNNFTVNNLTSIDQTTDTPTNNFATFNPLNAYNSTTVASLSEGNLKISGTASDGGVSSTIGVSTGKWYWEVKYTTESGGDPVVGIINSAGANKIKYTNSGSVTSGSGVWCMFNLTSGGVGFQENGVFVSYPSSTLASGDILNIAIDVDAQKLWYGKNGTWYNSGNPATGLNAISTNLTANETWFAYIEKRNSSSISETNFGNPTFSISSGNSDANGYGNFEYAVPSGYYALNTKNLAEYG